MSSALQSPCDRGVAETAPAPLEGAPAHSNWILAATILASSLAFVDGSVVNVGLPAIGRSFGSDGAGLAWILNGYLLPLSALLLIGGAAGDRYGRRKLLMIGTALFAVASLLCAVAPNPILLLTGRIAQGVGAALLMPNSLAILGTSFTGERRGRAIGIWAAIGAGAGALGPLVGGWLIDAVGWRSIFLINLPIAAAAVLIAWRFVPEEGSQKHASLDVVGGTVVSFALAALTWGLTNWSATQHADAMTLLTLAAGGVALGAFVLIERRLGARAMLPLALFRSADFRGLSLLTLTLYGALGGLLVLVPYVLIESRGYSATAAGAALLPLPLVIAMTSSSMGRIAGKVGARTLLVTGPLIVAAGCVLMMRTLADGSYWITAFPGLLVIAVGMSCAVAPLTTAVLSSVEPEYTGAASGFNSAIARTGGLIASALLGGVLATQGAGLTAMFNVAMGAAALAALAAGAAAFVWVGRQPSQ